MTSVKDLISVTRSLDQINQFVFVMYAQGIS